MLWCLLFLLPYSALGIDNIIDTNTGKVRGTTVFHNGHIVQVFKGIPFAKPPVGDLRFRKTVPVDPWDDILEATEFGHACIQPYSLPVVFPGDDYLPGQSEDCLNLNIWVPANTTKDSKKAVMFWIYGGNFLIGSNRLPLYDGGTMALEDVLVVNINYRINVLGFLSSSSDKAPGNMGLFDILEALKWVNQNINAFGGDSNRITLFGESAGATSIGLLCISPLAKDLLFQRVIMESSSPAYDFNDLRAHNLVLGQKLAESVGCASNSHSLETFPDDVIECLKTKCAKDLVNHASSNICGFGFWTIAEDKFLPKDPKLQLIAGDFRNVDVLIGHNQDEGSIFFDGFSKLFFNPYFNKTTGECYIRKMFQCNATVCNVPVQCTNLAEEVVHYYLGDVKEYDFETILEQTYHSYGDYGIVCPDMYFGESYAKKGNDVYAYYFNVIPSYSSFPFPRWMGSVHSAEVAFVFGDPLNNPTKYTVAEQLLSQRMIKIWTHFAKYGNPGEDWEKFSRENQYFKELITENRKSYLEDHKRNCEFFRKFSGFE